MFTTSSIAAYVESPDTCNIELTEAIWSELGWTKKEHCVRKIESELLENVDYRVSKVAQAAPGNGSEVLPNVGENSGGRPSKQYSLSYNGLKILAASTTTPKGRAYRRHLVEIENKYIQLMRAKPVRSLSNYEQMEVALKALTERLAQERFCDNKPGLKNILEQASQANALDAHLMDVEAIAYHVYGVQLSAGELNSLGRLCAGTYRTWHNAEPRKVEDPSIKRNVCVYGTEMYSTVENWLINKGYLVDQA